MYEFVIRGTRGTLAACRSDCLRYGGNTTCFSLRTPEGMILFDAGTGISNVTADLADRPSTGAITLLFTHFHMDHLIGFPGFTPFYSKDTDMTLMADPGRETSWRDDLRMFMRRPFWPIALYESEADMTLTDLPPGEPRVSIDGVEISWMQVPHPQQCLAYRVELPGGCAVVIATDTEYEVDRIDPRFVDFCRGANHLIYDAQYRPDEYPSHRGWGHSTWETAARVATAADVGQLILTHHEPSRKDDEVDAIVADAVERFHCTVGATENLVVCRSGH